VKYVASEIRKEMKDIIVEKIKINVKLSYFKMALLFI
jgi:hypothetical protein